jgi:hypothetical protein
MSFARGGDAEPGLKPSSATLALGAAVFSFLSPLFIPRAVLPFGFSFFFCWAALCVACVLADRLILWACLSCGAIFVVSIGWWMNGPPATDEFGFGAIDAIVLFVATALVVGGTGALSVIQTTSHGRGAR